MSQSIYIAKSAYGPVKIGVAKDIRIRLSNIQISSPVDVTLEYAANCDGDMRAVEQRAHSILSDKRMRGEWFKTDASEAILAIAQAAKELGYELTLTPIESPKRGRPSIGLGNIMQIRLDDATAEAVEDYASRTAQDRSAALRALIRAGLASDTGGRK